MKTKKPKQKTKKPEVRYLNDMKEVVFDKEWLKTAPNFELYYMCRGIKQKDELRYDITTIPPRMLGKEFVKTKGNRNSDGYPELYNVFEGELYFLTQKSDNGIVNDVKATKLCKGDWIVIRPDYYVIAINPTKKVAAAANWVSQKNKNIYSEMEKMNGACYYYTKSGWVKNKNYKNVPKLRFEKPLKRMPKNLDFLTNG